MDIKENYEAFCNMHHLQLQPSQFYFPAIDPLAPYGVPQCYMEMNGARRKNATRETTSTLKAWLNDHRKNPYPTKGEKIMLAICTKMTLTQVSTWFANARRRLKKENKMTWSPRNRCDEDDDYIDDEPLANSANDKCSSRSASVSSVQQQNNMLQIKNEPQNNSHHSNNNQTTNQHSSSNASNLNDRLNDVQPHPIVPFGLPNLTNGLTNGLSNSSALAQQQLAAAIAAANQLPPQLSAQLTPQQQLLLGSDPNSMAAFMQQQLAAFHHQHQHQLNQLNSLNNNIKKLEEDSTEIVDIEDNSNLGSLSDSDSINPSSAVNQQQFYKSTGLSNHNPIVNNHHSQVNNHHKSQSNNHQLAIPPSAASLLHQSQNSSINQLSNLHQIAAAAVSHLNPSVMNPAFFDKATLFNAANVAASFAANSLSNILSPMSKSTAASLNKPKIWSIVDIATNSTAANLLESNHLSKDIVKSEKKTDNSSILKVPSVTTQSTGISISSPITTITNTVTTIKKE